jgi:diguanylate cyclase (GGDEF)-like protein/PAS domain S-box-containing protein
MNTSMIEKFLFNLNRLSIKFRFFRLLPLLSLCILLMVTYQFWNGSQREANEVLQTDFNAQVQEVKNKIEIRMQNNEHLLRGVQGLFAASIHVERSEFHIYVNEVGLKSNYPGMQSLGFTLLVAKQDKIKHINTIRKEGFHHYSIHPEGHREIYTSVLYIEPLAGRNLLALGLDNYADPVRRIPMEQARDSDKVVMSGKLKLIQETNEQVQVGFMMWAPVYKHGVAHNTLAERHAKLLGWVNASFNMDDLMASILPMNSNLDLEIYDGLEMSDQTLLHDANKIRRDRETNKTHFQKISALQLDGHNWTLLFSSTPNFDVRMGYQKTKLIAWLGVTASILLSLVIWILVQSRVHALLSAEAYKLELSERKRIDADARLAATVFDTVDTAVLVTDKDARIIKVNSAFSQITGYTAEEAIGNSPHLLSSGSHSAKFFKEMWHSLNTTGNWQGEISNRRKNGEFYIEWLSINAVHDNEGNVINYVSLFSDISERKAAEDHLHNLAHYDVLTGLPNRSLLADRLQQAIAAARREKSLMALMFIDLDKFKPVNDSHGHNIGDLLLKEVARRMLECLRESDSAARVGGDEFVVLLPNVEAQTDAVAVGEKIRHALYQPFIISGKKLEISSSIGVAVYPEHGSDEKALLKHADIAMYYAKEAGRNNVKLYNPLMQRKEK